MICPYCNNEAKYWPNSIVYGKNYGKSFMCYYCKDCDAYVWTHNNTKEPLGTMANKELRKLRMICHWRIDPLWKSWKMKRAQVYQMLYNHFWFTVHVWESDIDMCKKIIEFMSKR